MKLTGKCKEDFEEWYNNNVDIDIQDLSYFSEKIHYLEHSTESMQYGVYVDFFDSVSIYTSIEPLYDEKGTNRVCIYSLLIESNIYIQCSNRKEARTKSIEKANEIYNNNK